MVVAKPLSEGASFTVNVKLCVAAEPTPLLALIVTVYAAPVPTAGVPESRPALLRVTPVGSEPELTLNVDAGVPVAVKLNVPGVPTTKVVALPEVICEASLTVMTTARLAALPMPLLAPMVTG